MRVTIVNQFYKPDLAPTAHLTASLAEFLVARGDQVRVITSGGGYVDSQLDHARGWDDNPRIFRLWTPKLGKKRVITRLIDYASYYFGALWRMLIAPRQDVIVVLTTPPLIGLVALAHKLLHPRTRIILWNMDCYPDIAEVAGMAPRGGIVSRLWEWFTLLEFRWLSHVVVLDQAMRELIATRYVRDKPLPIRIIPNWEAAELFPRPQLRPVAALKHNPFTVLYLGNAGFGHTFETVMEAANLLRDEAIRFVFIGGGHRYKQIEQMIAKLDLKNVELRGYVPKEETPKVMAEAGAALITLSDDSRGIMSPSKLHANLAMGLPIVYVGPPDTNVDTAIADYDCGIALRHGSSTELAEYIRRLASDISYQTQVRQNARRAFESSYSDKVTLPQFAIVIEQATGH